MIFDGIIEFRFAVPTNRLEGGDFHDKFGIFADPLGNKLSFNGSVNDSTKGMVNYESLKVFKSWAAMEQYVAADEARFERYLGYQVGVFTTDNDLGLDEARMQMYGVPGKQVAVRSTRGIQTLAAYFLFKQPTQLRYDYQDVAQHKQLLASVFAGEGWEVPRLLEKMHTAPDLYFDAVSQIRMQTWSHGRAVLLGDAGYCPALLTGQGSTLAMMGAYILAGELKVALGDHKLAFARYEQAFRPVVIQEQKKAGANARILVPATPVGLWVQTHLFPLLVPPLLVAIERGRRLLPRSSSRPSRLKDYGNVLPPS
jgi:2-polyprenyl-6-methoxyphenol hydroxylase-like FAD-dependent oxidoreductase